MNALSGTNGFAEDIGADLVAGRVLELAELYALDAVSAEERSAIESHLAASDPAVREAFSERVRQAREALVQSYAVEAEPPAGILAGILAALPRDIPAPGRPLASVPDRLDERVGATETAPAKDELTVRREARARRMGPRQWIAAAAVAAVVVVGGVAVGTSISTSQDPTNQILHASDVTSKQAAIGPGTATLRISASKDAAVVTLTNVPAPPAGKVYQMWLIPAKGAPVSEGLMDAAALSKEATIHGVNSAAVFAITLEPAGGSAQPTQAALGAVTLHGA